MDVMTLRLEINHNVTTCSRSHFRQKCTVDITARNVLDYYLISASFILHLSGNNPGKIDISLVGSLSLIGNEYWYCN